MTKDVFRGFAIFHYGEVASPEALVDGFLRAEALPGTGRGAIKILKVNGQALVCRKYLHGGIFRKITVDAYLTARRAVREMDILRLLKQQGVNVVRPLCAMATCTLPFKRLFLITLFEEGARDLVESARKAGRTERLRLARALAHLVWSMLSQGVYHPDLHLRNVLVAGDGALVLLDFDKAKVRPIGPKEVLRLVWRLYRYTEKLRGAGILAVSPEERMVFLRVLSRLSGFPIADEAEKGLQGKRRAFRAGWFFESLLYGRASPNAGGPRTTLRDGGGSGTRETR